jgi:hypothetical protein
MTEAKQLVLNLLRDNREKYHIDWKGRFSNHVTHGVIALYELGGILSILLSIQHISPSLGDTTVLREIY